MADCFEKPAIIIDNGTGYTKMGYAGNSLPSFVEPTVIAHKQASGRMQAKAGIDDLDFYIGKDALNRPAYIQTSPIKEGIIKNWTHMEQFWHRSLHQYLRCDPEEHAFMLTEPPMNPPENREYAAEVFFESFNAPALNFQVQAVLALTASCYDEKTGDIGELTGTVVDSGDGCTHVIPVCGGYVVSSGIRQIPLAGRAVSDMIQSILKERNEPVPPEDSLAIATYIKENHCFVCDNMPKQFRKFDADPEKYFRQYIGQHRRTGEEYTVDIGYERFIGPELYFNPEIYSSQWTKPLSVVVTEAIRCCSVDYQRKLYGNIVLSGGSTMFPQFKTRLQRDLKTMVDLRLPSGKPVSVTVEKPKDRNVGVWKGGSIVAESEMFEMTSITKQMYEEEGPRIARRSVATRV
eukprot:TRINITY_DN777920_c0_g1_i1.p1 TRINITY_DN777920_c0_g1~~TRINITY_DN777920_c0_g1_i1.p1  ORF type:complete len:405 (-),score=117.81 TRINITY_DN777920_c0_g1_i1:87-1301(-)